MAPVTGPNNHKVDFTKFTTSLGNNMSQITGNDKFSQSASLIGDCLNGSYGNAAESLVTSLTGNSTAGLIAGQAVSVALVLANKYDMSAGQRDAAQDLSQAQTIANNGKTVATNSNNQAVDVSKITTDVIAGAQSQVQQKTDEAKTKIDEHKTKKDEVKDKNESTKSQIEAEQAKIKQNQTRMAEIEKILQSKRSKSAPQPKKDKPADTSPQKPNPTKGTNPPAPATTGSTDKTGTTGKVGKDKNEKSATPDFTALQPDGENDELIAEYNRLGVDNATSQALIDSYNEQMSTDNETVASDANETLSVSEDTENEIDLGFNDIKNAVGEGKEAIEQISNLLQGNIPKLDKAMAIKLSGEMIKASISGTNSGLLAAAASAMGVSSAFSFGSTAAEATKLWAASGNEIKNKAGYIAKKFVMDTAKQEMSSVLNQANTAVAQILPQKLTPFASEVTSYFTNQTSILNNMMASIGLQNSSDKSGNNKQQKPDIALT